MICTKQDFFEIKWTDGLVSNLSYLKKQSKRNDPSGRFQGFELN